jgi:hypothetical protein
MAPEARRLWDEVMTRLTVVLQAKGIVRVRPTEMELIDLPLTALRSIPLPDGKLVAALVKLGTAVAEGSAAGGKRDAEPTPSPLPAKPGATQG